MRKVPKHKMIVAKSCPKCSMQLPIASKTCACGHIFVGRRSTVAQEGDATSITRRRTERVKREKPNYYDALEYDKETRKQKQRKRSMRTADQSQNKSDEQIGADDDVVHLKRKRKRNFRMEQDSDDRDNCFQIISPENGFKCSVILSEINRKMGVTSWRV